MILTRLSVLGFRNLAEQQLSFSPKVNIIAGANGQGKTNLLEAIYVLALSRSFRTHHSRELIRRDGSEFSISGQIQTSGPSYELSLQLGQSNRILQVNGSRRDVFEYVGQFNVIVFSSIQVEQFRAESEQRRRLIDRGLYHLKPAHLRRMADYSRLIRQKNSLLRDSASLYNKTTYELLDVWDVQIAELGSRIVQCRELYIQKIREKLAVRSSVFTPESLDVKYLAANQITSTASLADIQLQLSKRLKENRGKELRLKRCVTGPHRDEVVMEIDGSGMQCYASAGQQRSALLAFSLAQMEVYFDSCGEFPVYLIDDVDSELDATRMNELLRVLESKTQVFLTTTKPSLIQINTSHEQIQTFQVQSGRIQNQLRRNDSELKDGLIPHE